LGLIYGIFKQVPGSGVQIHNLTYLQVIFAYMTSNLIERNNEIPILHSRPFQLPDNALDMKLVLTKFQTFMHEQYSAKDRAFVEREGRLIFLAFLKPILNGAGHDFKEPQISEERRLDIAVTFNQHKYIVELKLWYGEKAFEEGLEQLGDYLEKQNLTEGFLVVFDHSKKRKTRQQKDLEIDGKKVFAVWV
jgi:PD-(D/E)XK nuclease superfamily